MQISRTGAVFLNIPVCSDNKIINKMPKNMPDCVSFGSTGIDGSRMRKMFTGIHCPCCGIKMLSVKELHMLANIPNNTPAKKILPILIKYKNSMHQVEKDVLTTLEETGAEYPNLTIRELLDKQRKNSLSELFETENKIIDRIRHVGSFISPEAFEKLETTLQEAKELLTDNNTTSTFKRRAFIAKIADATSYISEKDIAETIFNISKELPRAGTNKNAFIVKFTEKKPATGEERTSQDIVRALFQPSVATIEHIKAKSNNVLNGGGANIMKNYILECSRDNNLRGSMLFRDFVKQNPQFFGKFTQQYIDEIILRLNHGGLKGFEQYPIQISRTLRRQSKGRIQLDISKLNGKFYKENEYGKNSRIE